jgi:hypothetical protein
MVVDSKKLVVVLGPGRSGTSLLMQILGALGMHLSDNMIDGRYENPEGFFEDKEIVETHKALYRNLNGSPTLPLPDGWFESESRKEAMTSLGKILENRLEKCNGIWGFKDPRVSSFLPLWTRIFNTQGIVPVFLLALRNPASVASSLKRQINRNEAVTELQWLQRTTDALQNTAADCFIVHYEDWFADSLNLARELLVYTGLDQHFSGQVDEVLKSVVKSNLNRAVYDEYEIQNQCVRKLYDVLRDCRGDNFDRDLLMASVKDCQKTMNGFKGWHIEAHNYMIQFTLAQEKLKIETARKKELKTLLEERKQLKQTAKSCSEIEKDLHEITLQNNDYLKQLKDLQAENEYLRSQLQYAKSKRKWLKKNVALLLSSPVATIKKIACNLGLICKVSAYKSYVVKIVRKIKQRGRRIKSLWRKEK